VLPLQTLSLRWEGDLFPHPIPRVFPPYIQILATTLLTRAHYLALLKRDERSMARVCVQRPFSCRTRCRSQL